VNFLFQTRVLHRRSNGDIISASQRFPVGVGMGHITAGWILIQK